MEQLCGTSVGKYYPVNGVQLHVQEFGDPRGPVVVLLHGFPEFWYGWRRQIPYFAERGYRVIVPDGRGYNRSSKPKGIRAYRVSELTQDIVQLITTLTADRVYVVGHDWGAILTWQLAMRAPHLLHGAVMINVPHPRVMIHTLRKRLDQLRRSWYMFFFQLPGLPEWLARRNHYGVMSQMLTRTSRPGTFSEAELQVYRQAWAQPGSFRAMIHWYRALRYGLSRREVYRPVEVPALVIWGAKDAFLRAEMAQRSVQQCVRGALRMFEDATHWVHLEKSEEVNAAIEAFIRETQASGSNQGVL